jgi:DNA polymerase-3 subunit gamma/tau
MPEPKIPYQVVARRFRPRSFGEVVGQDSVLQSLRSTLASGRIPHAFLFAGSRGVGKTTLARILARALNCERGPTPEPCGACAPCRSILDGSNPDLIELDAASHNSVEDIRDLRERVGTVSHGARFKVYILDEVHMLSRSAWNAFLKTLEEPPPNVVFVLATTELQRVPDTIRSRCQVLHFRRVVEPEIVARLQAICVQEGVELPADVLADVARSSRGGMRDAETMLERLLPLAREQGTRFDFAAYQAIVERVGLARVVELAGELLRGNAPAGLRFADEVVRAGADEREALGDLLEVLRALLVLRIDGPETSLLGGLEPQRQQLAALAGRAEPDRLDAMIQAALRGREAIRRLEDRRLLLEVALFRIAQAGELPTLAELAARGPAAAPEEPAPAAAPAAPAAMPRPAGLYAQLLARAGQELPALVSTLEQCRLDEPDERGTVRLRLQSDKKLHLDRLANPAIVAQLQQLFTEVAGGRWKLALETGAAPPPSPAPPSRTPGASVQRVIERFDGTLLGPEEA